MLIQHIMSLNKSQNSYYKSVTGDQFKKYSDGNTNRTLIYKQ